MYQTKQNMLKNGLYRKRFVKFSAHIHQKDTPKSHRNNIHTPKPKSNIVPNVDNNNPGNGAKTTQKAKYKIFNEAQ